MGGKRAPFHVRSRKRSPFWQFAATIDGIEIRESLETRVADDPGKRKAGPEAGARYLFHCARLGSRAQVGAVETDTMRLVGLYSRPSGGTVDTVDSKVTEFTSEIRRPVS